MKKILLCCAAGMSTSLLVSKMKKHAEEMGVPSKIWAISVENLQESLQEGVDVVLLGPQIKYKLADVKGICSKTDIPVDVINMIDYGMMNGKNVFNFALNLIK